MGKQLKNGVLMMLPNDPFLLFSVLNTKLRDYYKNLDDLCYDLQIDKQEIIKKISDIGYEYDNEKNQFTNK